MLLYLIQTPFWWIAAFVVATAGVNPNGIKTLLANGLSAFSIKENSVLGNGPKWLPRNTPDCPIVLCNWVFESFILADEPFAKDLRSHETYVSANNNLCGKLFSPKGWPMTFEQIFKVTLVPFFIPCFNLLINELNNFTFKVRYSVIFYWYYVSTK